MSFVTGTFSVVCDKCGHQHDFSSNDADFDATAGGERQMGAEHGYQWDTEFKCDNDGCDNQIEIEYEVWEYPEGSFNNDDIRAKGAAVADKFDYDFSYDPDEDEDE